MYHQRANILFFFFFASRLRNKSEMEIYYGSGFGGPDRQVQIPNMSSDTQLDFVRPFLGLRWN